jgi:hypothetical protein
MVPRVSERPRVHEVLDSEDVDCLRGDAGDGRMRDALGEMGFGCGSWGTGAQRAIGIWVRRGWTNGGLGLRDWLLAGH